MKNLEFLGHEEYSVTKCGKVWSHSSNMFIKPSEDKGGYLRVGLSKRSKKTRYSVHRLVALAFIPNPENKRTVNHKDGVKTNNHVDNLEWNTHLENIRHSWDTGLRQEDLVRCVRTFDDDDVHKLCLMTVQGYSRGHINRTTGVPEWLVKNVVTGRQYRDISKHYDLENRPQVIFGANVSSIKKVYENHFKGLSDYDTSLMSGVDIEHVRKIVKREVLFEMYDLYANKYTIAETIPKGSTPK